MTFRHSLAASAAALAARLFVSLARLHAIGFVAPPRPSSRPGLSTATLRLASRSARPHIEATRRAPSLRLLASRERQAARVGQVSFYHQAQIVAPGLKVACVCAQWRSRSSTTQARYMPVLASSARRVIRLGLDLRLCPTAFTRARAHWAVILRHPRNVLTPDRPASTTDPAFRLRRPTLYAPLSLATVAHVAP